MLAQLFTDLLGVLSLRFCLDFRTAGLRTPKNQVPNVWMVFRFHLFLKAIESPERVKPAVLFAGHCSVLLLEAF